MATVIWKLKQLHAGIGKI